jgi:hypothetical protein
MAFNLQMRNSASSLSHQLLLLRLEVRLAKRKIVRRRYLRLDSGGVPQAAGIACRSCQTQKSAHTGTGFGLGVLFAHAARVRLNIAMGEHRRIISDFLSETGIFEASYLR